MARASQKAEGLGQRTPVLEWLAASAGLAATLAVIGYTLWEGLTSDQGPPELSVAAQPAVSTPTGFVVPIIVRNTSDATAAQVTVRGRVRSGEAIEERTIRFGYVPGGGEARGGLIFQADPAHGNVDYSVDGYAEP